MVSQTSLLTQVLSRGYGHDFVLLLALRGISSQIQDFSDRIVEFHFVFFYAIQILDHLIGGFNLLSILLESLSLFGRLKIYQVADVHPKRLKVSEILLLVNPGFRGKPPVLICLLRPDLERFNGIFGWRGDGILE